MLDLAGRIAAEEADAAGAGVGGRGQFGGTVPGPGQTVLLEVPVLAEQAVERAGFVEHGQVRVSVLGPLCVGEIRISGRARGRADPIGHAVGRQGVVVPLDGRGLGIAAADLPVLIASDAAVADLPGVDLAGVDALPAAGALARPGWICGQMESSPRAGVGGRRLGMRLRRLAQDTPGTQAQGLADVG